MHPSHLSTKLKAATVATTTAATTSGTAAASAATATASTVGEHNLGMQLIVQVAQVIRLVPEDLLLSPGNCQEAAMKLLATCIVGHGKQAELGGQMAEAIQGGSQGV